MDDQICEAMGHIKKMFEGICGVSDWEAIQLVYNIYTSLSAEDFCDDAFMILEALDCKMAEIRNAMDLDWEN